MSINFLHPPKLLLQKIFLKIKLRKFLQKCLTPEKIVISTPEHGMPQIPKKLCSKTILGVSDESNFNQIIKGSSPLMVLKLFKYSSLT